MDILNSIMSFITSAMGASATIAVVLEFVFRLIPTKKPLSIIHLVSAFARKISEVLLALANFLDKVLPQNVSAEVK